jgi:hypothetical protein
VIAAKQAQQILTFPLPFICQLLLAQNHFQRP